MIEIYSSSVRFEDAVCKELQHFKNLFPPQAWTLNEAAAIYAILR